MQPQTANITEGTRPDGIFASGNRHRGEPGRPAPIAHVRRGKPVHCFCTPTVREIPLPFARVIDDSAW